MKVFRLWWALLRFGVFCALPLSLGAVILMVSASFGWPTSEGGVLVFAGVLVVVAFVSLPIFLLAGMLPAEPPVGGTELPSAVALRARLISGGLALVVWLLSLGFPWLMVCSLSNISVPRFVMYFVILGALVAQGAALLYGYCSRCTVCAAYAVSVRPLAPGGTICRCRRCGAFSCWRSE
jgi:hypothetical protein